MELHHNAGLTAASCSFYWKLDEKRFSTHTHKHTHISTAQRGMFLISALMVMQRFHVIRIEAPLHIRTQEWRNAHKSRSEVFVTPCSLSPAGEVPQAFTDTV